ncbi:LacI family DNA-binding transcriptional regulator [Georgenia phoenicis]|uniref:LacI family DNA-binding transcriptional regulator n=1 Tax=unclassified Georgenia TaxID=2626815 RepID=UPI0039AF0A31
MPKRPTLADVSRVAGFSVYTVSRALSGADGVSDEARQRVLDAARDLGYVRNSAAQQLRKNTRSRVAVITASTSNAYYIEMMAGVQRVLRGAGRSAVVADIAAQGVYSPETEDAAVEGVIESRTAGVISTLPLSAPNLRLLDQWDVPIVFVDSSPPAEALHATASVTTDNLAASHAMGNHLATHGYRDWLFLAYPSRWTTRAPREHGLADAATTHGARLTTVECDNDPDSAATVLLRHLTTAPQRPDVIVAGNNPLLQGALTAVRELGLDVPSDVAMVAYDEFPWAPLIDPPMTVLNEDSATIGERAARVLMRLIDDQVSAELQGRSTRPAYRDGDHEQVTASLVIRRSCGC